MHGLTTIHKLNAANAEAAAIMAKHGFKIVQPGLVDELQPGEMHPAEAARQAIHNPPPQAVHDVRFTHHGDFLWVLPLTPIARTMVSELGKTPGTTRYGFWYVFDDQHASRVFSDLLSAGLNLVN